MCSEVGINEVLLKPRTTCPDCHSRLCSTVCSDPGLRLLHPQSAFLKPSLFCKSRIQEHEGRNCTACATFQHDRRDGARSADCCSLAVFGCMMRRHGRPRCHDKSAKTADRVVTTEMRTPPSPDNYIVPTLLEDPSWIFGEAPTPKYDAWPPGPIQRFLQHQLVQSSRSTVNSMRS